MHAINVSTTGLRQSSFVLVAAEQMDSRRGAIVELQRVAVIDLAAVNRLRREIFADGAFSRDEADALFALERSATPKDSSWSAFFVEAITSHIVWDIRPTGVVNESQGEWLIAAADRTRSPAALDVLVNVLEAAHRTPLWFGAAVKARAARGWPSTITSAPAFA